MGLISSHFPSTRFPGKAVCRGQGVGGWVRLGVIFQIAWGKMKTNKTHGIAGDGSGSQDMEPTGLMKSVPRSSKRHTRWASKQPGVQRCRQKHRDAARQPDSRARQFAGAEERGLASDVESFSVNQIPGQGSLPGPRSRGLCPTWSHFPSTRFPGKAVCRGRGVGC